MNSYAAIARAQRPRSRILSGASMAVFVVLVLITREVGGESAAGLQIATTSAAAVLAIVGVVLGSRIRQLRNWPAAVLVPGLLNTHVRFDVFAIIALWGIWLLISGTALSLQPSSLLPLASGIFGVWAGAAAKGFITAIGAFLISAIIVVAARALSSDGVTTLALAAVAGLAWLIVTRTVERPLPPPTPYESASSGLLQGQLRFAQWLRGRAFDRLRRGRVAPPVRLELALGLSPLVDWVSAFCLSLTAPLVLAFIFALNGGNPRPLFAAATAMNALWVIVLAPLSLAIYERQLDRLWLVTSQSRNHLAREILAICLGQSIRLATCSIVVVGTLSCFLDVDPLPAIAFFVLSAASAAVLTTVSIWLRNSPTNSGLKTISRFGSAIVLVLCQYQLVDVVVGHRPVEVIILMLAISAGVAFIAMSLGVCVFARRPFPRPSESSASTNRSKLSRGPKFA